MDNSSSDLGSKLKSVFESKIRIKSKHTEGSFFKSEKSFEFSCIPLQSPIQNNYKKKYFTVTFTDYEGSMFRFTPKPISQIKEWSCFYIHPLYPRSITYDRIHLLNDPRIVWFDLSSNYKPPKGSSVDHFPQLSTNKESKSIELFFDLGKESDFGKGIFKKSEMYWYMKVDQRSIETVSRKSLPSTYITKKEDTPLSIAVENAVSIEDIIRLNEKSIYAPDEILKDGQEITLPIRYRLQSHIKAQASHKLSRGQYLLDSKGDLAGIMVNENYAFILSQSMNSSGAIAKPSSEHKVATMNSSQEISFTGASFDRIKSLKSEVK